MAKIKVNTARLGKDAERIQNCIKSMRKQLTSIKNQSAQLDAMWEGSSSETLKMDFQNDIKKLETIIKNLDKIYDYEMKAKQRYDRCENDVASVVKKIRV